MRKHVGALKPLRKAQVAVASAAAVALTAGAVVIGSAVSPQAPQAQAATIKGNVGYGEILNTQLGNIFVGPLAASSADASALGVSTSGLFWCVQWNVNNVKGVTSNSRTTVSSSAAATANYIIQDRSGNGDNHSRIAIAVHELLDAGKSNNTRGYWGYERSKASGTFKNRLTSAQGWIKSAQDRRGPYKLAPAVTLSSDKQSISLTDTWVKSVTGANIGSFAGKKVQVKGTITGNATFSNGKKSLTFNAGDKQTLKVTGSGAVKVALTSAKVLPAPSVKQLTYSSKRSQNKIMTGGLIAASGSKSVTVPAPPKPALASNFTDKADGDKKLPTAGGTGLDTYTWTVPATGIAAEIRVTVKDTSDKKVVTTKTAKFTPAKTSGTNAVELTIPKGYAGKSLAATAELWQGGKLLLTHNASLTDAKQIIQITPPTAPDMGTTAQTLVDGVPDGDKQLDYVYGDPAYGDAKWVAPADVPNSETLGNINGLTATDADGKTTIDPNLAEAVDADKGIYKDNDGHLVNRDGYLVDEQGNLVLRKTQGYFERQGTSAVTAQTNDVVEYGKKVPATDYIGVTGDLVTRIMDQATGKEVTASLVSDSASLTSKQTVTAKTGKWTTPTINLNMGTRTLTQRYVPEDQTGQTAPNWDDDAVTTDTDDSKVITKTKYVFFEDWIVGGKKIMSHTDINSTPQMFVASNPIMTSSASDPADGDQELPFSGGPAQDTVTASGLSVAGLINEGAKFRLDSSLFNPTTGTEDLGVSQDVEVLDQKKNTWTVTINVPNATYANTSPVFYARLMAILPNGEEILIIDHTNPDAKEQTIHVGPVPTGRTLALDATSGTKYLTENGGPVEDTLTFTEGFAKDEEYTFTLDAIEPGTCKVLGITKDFKTTFAPEGGEKAFTIDLPGRSELGVDAVAFNEKVTDKAGNVVFENDNCNNPAETVYYPKIGTVAKNAADDSKVFGPEGGVLDDTLTADGHGKGTYYAVGTLALKTGDKCEVVKGIEGEGTYEVLEDGKSTTGQVKIKIPANTGTTDITYVVYEHSYKDKDRKILQASHVDCNSEAQAVVVKAPKPTTPPVESTPPTTPVVETTPPTTQPPLAQTGVQQGVWIFVGLGFLVIMAGAVLVIANRRNQKRQH